MPIAFNTIEEFVLYLQDPDKVMDLLFRTGFIKKRRPRCCGARGNYVIKKGRNNFETKQRLLNDHHSRLQWNINR